MEKIQENICKQACSYCFRTRKLHQSTCSHVFSPFSAHFYPPLHHNGKGSIGGEPGDEASPLLMAVNLQ